ncbi:hypothetical protein JOB18_040641 [Solea senegalensis]|uniref:Uncharacterized protein n=1 Tax=Solea senegalensis TaxID=28829 RepID=A0AAV6SMY4_SOLSE|nr:hypothetical protein JOB18_040641 [Solea senegalensis]
MSGKPRAKPPKSSTKSQDDSNLTTLASSAASNDEPDSPELVLAAIQTMKDDFVSRFEGILGAIQGVQGDLKAMAGRMSEAEDRINNNEEDVATLKSYTTTKSGRFGKPSAPL